MVEGRIPEKIAGAFEEPPVEGTKFTWMKMMMMMITKKNRQFKAHLEG